MDWLTLGFVVFASVVFQAVLLHWVLDRVENDNPRHTWPRAFATAAAIGAFGLGFTTVEKLTGAPGVMLLPVRVVADCAVLMLAYRIGPFAAFGVSILLGLTAFAIGLALLFLHGLSQLSVWALAILALGGLGVAAARYHKRAQARSLLALSRQADELEAKS